jgi:hypothetical protein
MVAHLEADMRGHLTLALAAAALVTTAATANEARAAEVLEKASFKGKNAFTVFTGSVPITCADGSAGTLDTLLFLSGFQFVSKSRLFPDEDVNVVFVQMFQFDSCTGLFLTATGRADDAFRARGLTSASAQAAIPLSDFAGPVGTLEVDVDWRAVGPLIKTRSKSREEFETPEGDVIVTFSRSAGKTRFADATGTLVFNGSPLVGTFSDAFLDDSKTGDMRVQH